MRRVFWAVLGVALLSAGAAQAGFPIEVKKTCPVGGKTFSFETTGSYSTWGRRPDGKPFGSWDFPLALPVCPDNGLVMYRDFTPDEVKRLKGLLASPEYRAMRETETAYYRAAWLEKALIPDSPEPIWILLQASWEGGGDAARKARYQREFAEKAEAVPAPAAGQELDWIVLQARAINARRELGEFDKALAQLKALPLAGLDVTVPAATETNREAVQAAQNRRGWLEHLRELEVVIGRRDASPEPLDMIPTREAARRCVDMGAKADAEPLCAAESLAKEIERVRQMKAEQQATLARIRAEQEARAAEKDAKK